MLRAARLLLVASAAACAGVLVIIEARASAFAPIVLIFVAAAALFILGAAALERDARRGRLLSVAAACALAGMGTLAGFGAGDVTFPAAGLGVIAAWVAVMYDSPRRVIWFFVAYLAIGVLVNAPRLVGFMVFPLLAPSILLWPLTLTFSIPNTGGLPIYGAFGIAIALIVAAFVRRDPLATRPSRSAVLRDAIIAGISFVAVEAAVAFARTDTSARDELVPVALVIMFVSAAALAIGIRVIQMGAMSGVIVAGLAGSVVVYVLTARPTVTCTPSGAGTSFSPWYMPYFGGVRSTGVGAGSGTSSGRVERDDGVVITYRCDAGRLVEFEIRR